jgi:hypothetical protein
MSNLNQMELNTLREMIGGHQMMVKKLNEYAERCQDQQVKKMFHQASQSAQTSSQKLLTFL